MDAIKRNGFDSVKSNTSYPFKDGGVKSDVNRYFVH